MPASRGQPVKPLAQALAESLDDYFLSLNGHAPRELYDMVLAEVEPVLLKATLRHTQGNQSLAAEWLGLNRATLRKKLQQHQIDPRA